MPARYIQAIYKQYHIFSESQAAQQAAASEEMMEELEDGGMGIPMSGGDSNKNNQNNVINMETVREQQLRKIRENIAAAQSEDPEDIYRFNLHQRNNDNNPPSNNPS